MYRYRRLDEARLNAAHAGYRGAMFPWQSGSSAHQGRPRPAANGRYGPAVAGIPAADPAGEPAVTDPLTTEPEPATIEPATVEPADINEPMEVSDDKRQTRTLFDPGTETGLAAEIQAHAVSPPDPATATDTELVAAANAVDQARAEPGPVIELARGPRSTHALAAAAPEPGPGGAGP